MLMRAADTRAAPAVTFWGAAQSVTGSMHLVETAGRTVLLDRGLAHGPRSDPRLRDGGHLDEAEALGAALRTRGFADVSVPARGEVVTLA
jgi:metallo-beta-lactamase family protein